MKKREGGSEGEEMKGTEWTWRECRKEGVQCKVR